MLRLVLIAAATAQAALAPPAPAQTTSGVGASPPAMSIREVWMVSAGAPLSATLTGWAQRAGWTVVWETDDDFRLAAGATLTGDFPTAADALIQTFSQARPRLRAVFYSGNKVVRVWTERNEP